ncbi:ATP-grasp domain-containing protein [Citricoccus sp. NR2]|uniref:ATP-grasp domain-containing protein n=1 Tax=Citricoccus sp. NR2 TaxID=3004095 RepID=UPI0022DD0B51|nr:hypothetical protein [Citricoccus sp. NR2]WBL17767.1 hypothetical protein O1A05_08060 [Citricoccus sp. NR2]
MRIVILSSQPFSGASSVTAQCLEHLEQWGVTVDVVLPGTLVNITDLALTADLYLLKSPNDHVVGVATALEAAGARCVNPVSVVRTCRDRIAVTGVLAAAGVPVPPTWTTAELPGIVDLLDQGPVMLKSGRVGASMGHRTIWDEEDLASAHQPGQQWLVQRLQHTEDRDRKLYRIGDQVFGVKRRWPAATEADKQGEPFTVSAEHRRICDAAAEALGTDLFGLDLIETAEGPLVVDVHPFPGFKGVPNGALRLADYLFARLHDEPHVATAHQESAP